MRNFGKEKDLSILGLTTKLVSRIDKLIISLLDFVVLNLFIRGIIRKHTKVLFYRAIFRERKNEDLHAIRI